MADFVFDQFKLSLASGALPWSSATTTATVLLVDSSSTYAPSNADSTLADFFTKGGVELLPAASYARKTLTGLAATRDDANNRSILTATAVTFTAINDGTVKALLLFAAGADNAHSNLIAYLDSGGSVITNGSDLNLNWSASGIFTLG